MNILNIMVLTSTAPALMKLLRVTLHCLNKHLEELLPVVAEVITRLYFS